MKVCVLGCGAYGTALSLILNENGNRVTMWSNFSKEASKLNETRECLKLPSIKIPKSIKITHDFEPLISSDLIIIAIPTAFIRSTLIKVKKYIMDKPILIASKGIEQDTGLFISDMVKEIIKTDNFAVLSGPSFAIDIANGSPVGLSLACQIKETTDLIVRAFENSHFKIRVSTDILGVEICGAIKNIMAIASGILSGMGATESTGAMFLTESIHDIKELIKGFGGDGDTILSFAGFGDLLLTCTSPKSRNYSFGYMIGKGASNDEILNYLNNTTVEGVYTLKSIMELTEGKNVSLPITNLIYDIIFNGKEPQALIEFLISKP